MVLEDSTNDEGISSPSLHSNENAPSRFPASLGPGAKPASGRMELPSAESFASTIEQVREIRSHYSIDVRDSTLHLGYDLRGAVQHYNIPFDKMPVSGPTVWLLFSGPARRTVTGAFLIDIIRGAHNMAGRPLTQSEVEGYTLHASRRVIYNFSAVFSAIGIGSGMAWYGRKKMKFPFLKPRPLELYETFPGRFLGRFLPTLKGRFARTMWHITRANVYIALSFLLLSPLYSSMGSTAMMVGLYRDARTHELTKSLADALKKSNGIIDRHSSNRPVRSPSGIPSQAQGGESNYDADDAADASSTSSYGAAEDYAGDTSFTDGTTDTNVLDDSQMQLRESPQRSPTSATSRKWGSQQPDRAPDAHSDADFLFDDASPTAGNDPDMTTGLGSDASQGSAWSRIRRGAAPTQPKRTSNRPPVSGQGAPAAGARQGGAQDPYETSGDSFSFSSSDQEKQLAKEQAQRDFDRMLEEERRGVAGDGMSGSGNSGAWERRRER
jgi:hypothetical protein